MEKSGGICYNEVKVKEEYRGICLVCGSLCLVLCLIVVL